MTDLYAALGLDARSGPTLTADEIHDAYKRQAKRTHPDMPGGSTAAFQKAEAAFAVLGDEQARAYYHATGNASAQTQDATLNEAVHAVDIALGQVIDHAVNPHDVDNGDVRGWMIGCLQAGKTEGEKRIIKANMRLAKAEMMNGRFKQKGTDNPVVQMLLDKRVAAIRAEIDESTHLLGVFDKAIAILKDTDYRRTLALVDRFPAEDYWSGKVAGLL